MGTMSNSEDIILHFIRICTDCYNQNNLKGQRYSKIYKILSVIPESTQ